MPPQASHDSRMLILFGCHQEEVCEVIRYRLATMLTLPYYYHAVEHYNYIIDKYTTELPYRVKKMLL